MVNTNFEAYKLKREIKRSGAKYEFFKIGKNSFGEETGLPEQVVMIAGLYHEQSQSIKITTGDTTQIRTKKIPMIMCLYEDTASFSVNEASDYSVIINGKVFKITGITNIQEWNIICDISLEVSDYVAKA